MIGKDLLLPIKQNLLYSQVLEIGDIARHTGPHGKDIRVVWRQNTGAGIALSPWESKSGQGEQPGIG